jgi:polar amino acid transport system substrate-binding protein
MPQQNPDMSFRLPDPSPWQAVRRLSALACLGLAWCWPQAVQATMVCPSRPIEVALYEFGAIYSLADGRKDPRSGKGLDLDLILEMERRSGCRFDVQAMTRKRIWTELEAGRLDLATSAIHTPEREQLYWYVDYLNLQHKVWMLRSKAVTSGAESVLPADRATLRWGAVRGYRHSPELDAQLDQARAGARLVEAVDDVQLLNLLVTGQVDVIIGHAMVVRPYLLAHPRQPDVVSLDWPGGSATVAVGLVFAKRSFDEAAMQGWRQLMREFRRDGTLMRLVRNYVPEDEARATLMPN